MPGSVLFAITEELKQHYEQVHEVQIQLQGAKDGFFACGRLIIVRMIAFLDPLGVIGGQTCKDQNTDRSFFVV